MENDGSEGGSGVSGGYIDGIGDYDDGMSGDDQW